MEELIRFGSRDYCLLALLLVFCRGMDFLSTYVATPNLVLEGNPVAKKLGWRWGTLLNAIFCAGIALSPITAIAVSTMSEPAAARNFQSAWLMRSMGEENYRDWHVARIQETRITLYLFCLAGNTLIFAAVGVALIALDDTSYAAVGIGLGMITYSVVVAFYTLLSIWRLRRATTPKPKRVQVTPMILVNSAALKNPLADSCACETSEYPGK